MRLAANNPDIAPLIDPGFLTDPRDVDGMLAGLRLAREIGQAPALAAWRQDEVLPGAAVTTAAQQRDFPRRSVFTYDHPVGTCPDRHRPGSRDRPAATGSWTRRAARG